jgi:hypothetical protein
LITAQQGVFITADDAALLADVLDTACRTMRPSARVADLARRLRQTVDRAAPASDGANGSANARAPQPDPGDIRAHDLLTAGDAARVIECTTANIRYLREHGHLPAHRAGSRWLYPAAAVVDYAERRASKRR